MSQQFRTVTTNAGRNAVREALTQGKTVKLSHMSVGDGGGNPVTPLSTMTKLVNERFRAQINDIVLDPATPDLFTAELFIPQAEGGWYIREVGLWMDDGTLFAVGNTPLTEKPDISSGAATDLLVRLIIRVLDAATVSIEIDPAQVLATREYVDRKLDAHNKDGGAHETLARKSVQIKAGTGLTGGGTLEADRTLTVKYCRAVADDHTHFIGTLEHGGILQRSAYAAAEALVLPSTLETPGLAALEAAAAGVPRVIITSIGCTREYFGNLATYLLPDEIPSIKDAVFRALATPGNSSGLQQHIRNNFTWQHAAHQLMNVYQEILQQQPNEKNSTQPQKQGITLTPNDILLPLSPSKNTEKIPHEGRYIHLSGEEGSCFHQPNIQLCAGHYEFEIEYSWWGSGRDANCILTSKEEKSLASAPLEEGPRRSLRLPFIIGSTTHDISLEIEIPKGCVLIVSWMKIHLNETYFLKQNIMSDIITYGLTTYKRVSEYDTIIPFQHFLLNGTSLCNKDSLLVYSHYHTNITGPYLSLPPGKYAVIMLYAYNKNIFSDSETQFSAYCDISINRGKEILYKKELVPGNNQHIGLPFELKEAVKDLEIRTSIPANYLVHFKKIHLFSFTPLTKKYDPQKKSLYISPFNQLVPEIISSEGWHPHNDEGTWTSTEKSFLNLALLPSNYILTITLTPFLGNKDFRTLHCLINNKEYKITKLYNAKTLFIFVTEDMFNGIPLLSLSFLSTEELTSPQECNLGIDTRKLGFLFHNLTFLPFTEELQREYENKPFSPDMPSIVTADGWHTPEASGTWTATQTASLILNKKPNDYEILLDVAPFLGGICYRTIHCLINGREYKKMKLCGPTTFSIQITQDMFNNSSFLSLTILSEEDLTSPQECNMSSDTRKLGFFVHKIVFH